VRKSAAMRIHAWAWLAVPDVYRKKARACIRRRAFGRFGVRAVAPIDRAAQSKYFHRAETM